MVKGLKMLGVAASALALTACASRPPLEDPHHYSKDVHGNRIACYATDVASEYECVPLYARYAHPYAYDPLYDPFWPSVSLGYYHGWPRHWVGTAYYTYPYPVHRPRLHRRR